MDNNRTPAPEGEEGFEHMERRTRRRPVRRRSVFSLIVQDLLLTGLVLCLFATFHHVIPRYTAMQRPAPTPVSIRPSPTQTPAPAETSLPDPEQSPAATPEPTPDPMDWRTKFAGHFTDEVVKTETSYSSPNLAFTIEKRTTEDGSATYFVADIYLAELDCFSTYWASGTFGLWREESMQSMAESSGALLSINGDYADSQENGGFLVRNGELYYDNDTKNDICVLYYDGSVETFRAGSYTVQDVLEKSPYQVWKFGPALLDEAGRAFEKFNTTEQIAWENPRSAFGYYEPGHYCFVTVDGRQWDYSRGLEIDKLAQLFESLGCKAAYNMDGGQSAMMVYNGAVVNHPYLGGRKSGDILLIREPEGGETP